MMGEPEFRHKRTANAGALRKRKKAGPTGPALSISRSLKISLHFQREQPAAGYQLLTSTAGKPDMASGTRLRHPAARMSAMPLVPRRKRAAQ
jgi:hypothetical protein